MRVATVCVVCADDLAEGVRRDCRYCGARCRMRAYRIRRDGGGPRRRGAQRRQRRTQRRDADSKETQAIACERDTLASQLVDAQQQNSRLAARIAELEPKLAESEIAQAQLKDLLNAVVAEANGLEQQTLTLRRSLEDSRQQVFRHRRQILDLDEELQQAQRSLEGYRATATVRSGGPQAATARTLSQAARNHSTPTPATASSAGEHARLRAELDRQTQILGAERMQAAQVREHLTTCKRDLATADNTLVSLRQQCAAQERDAANARHAADLLRARLAEQATQMAARDEEHAQQRARYVREILALQGRLAAAEKFAEIWNDPEVKALLLATLATAGGITEALIRKHYGLPPREPNPPKETPAFQRSASQPAAPAPSPPASPTPSTPPPPPPESNDAYPGYRIPKRIQESIERAQIRRWGRPSR